MSSFAHIVIRNCSFVNDSPFSIQLSATKSFPASRYTFTSYGKTLEADWSPRPLPQNNSHLEVTLVDFVAEGRIGITYTAHVNVATDGHGKDMQNLIGTQVVLKFAKPQFARSLAREAWFYECLEEAQRTAVAGCYGFYTTPLDADLHKDLLPWKQIKIEYKEAMPSEDILLDDAQIGYFNGGRQYYSASQWLSWRPNQGTLAVLVLEKLGERYPLSELYAPSSNEEYRADLTEVLQDVGATGVWHQDVTYFNTLRAPENAPVCPRHGHAHQWRAIDFDRSMRFDLGACLDQDREYSEMQAQWAFSDGTFWGSVE